MGFADQVSDGSAIVTEIHHAGWTAVDTEFMFERNTKNVIALAWPAVLIQQEFRRQEQ